MKILEIGPNGQQCYISRKEIIKSISTGENICREVLTVLFPNNIFKKCRPQWLMNKKPMELDFYCEELKLAIEFNGIQHYKFCGFFHKSESDFNNQLARDELKNKLCIENNVKLISVPYTIKNIGKFIMNSFKGLPIDEEVIQVKVKIENPVKLNKYILYGPNIHLKIRSTCDKICNIFKSNYIEPINKEYSRYNNENNFINGAALIEEATNYETELCKKQNISLPKKKFIAEWFKNKETMNFINNIKYLLNIDEIKYVFTPGRYSKVNFIQGTYIHPILIIFLANWVSPTYSLLINDIIFNV